MTKVIGENGYIGSRLLAPDSDYTVLLAGHSSVAMSANDPDGAWVNNVDFFRSVLRNSGRLIYASSASVYDGVTNPNEDSVEFHLKGMYDLTKRTIDSLAELAIRDGQQVYGLRFATVNGWSPNLRVDVMLNKMVHDALNEGVIKVQNPQLVRPILGINDCTRAIKTIIEGDGSAGIYNLASFAASVEDMAYHVAAVVGDTTVNISDTGTQPYAFGIDTTKFQEVYDFDFHDTLESVVEELVERYDECYDYVVRT